MHLKALEDTKGNLESMIATNKEDVERNSAQITSSIEGLDADLTTLSASFDEFANNAAPTLTTCKPMGEIRNSLLHKSVTTVPHVRCIKKDRGCVCVGFYFFNSNNNRGLRGGTPGGAAARYHLANSCQQLYAHPTTSHHTNTLYYFRWSGFKSQFLASLGTLAAASLP